jgi:hypothetical protein
MPTYQSNTTGVVSSFRDLHEDSQAISFRQDFDLDADGYATDAALQNQNIFAYVNDEVHAFIEMLLCENQWMTYQYNPIYMLIYAILYLMIFPGAALHKSLLVCIPIRKVEYPEVRDLRSQGIYTALGGALVNIPLTAIQYKEADSAGLEKANALSFSFNLILIAFNITGLIALSREHTLTLQAYTVGASLVALFLVFSTIYQFTEDVEDEDTGLVVAEYVLQTVLVLVYAFIAMQCGVIMADIDKESKQKYTKEDIAMATSLVMILGGFLVCYTVLATM